MSKVLGWVEVAHEDAEGETLAALERIETVAREVSRMSQKARRIETSMEARRHELETVDVVDVLGSVVADLSTVWPDADLVLSAPDSAPVRAPEAGLLETALRNAVENGIEHNDREHPRVEVTVQSAAEPDADEVAVSVADDGPGIPAIERDALASGTETALEHGSGLGLWLVRWIVQTAGGELDFAENEPRGSVVELRLPAAEG